MARRFPLKNVLLLALCAPLIGWPIVIADLASRLTIIPVSKWLCDYHLLGFRVTSTSPPFPGLYSLTEYVLHLSLFGLTIGWVAVIFLIALSTPWQLPPRRIDRAIRRAPKALLIGFVPVLLIDYVAFMYQHVPLSDVAEIACVASTLFAPVACLWFDAFRRIVKVRRKKFMRRQHGACHACGYDLRGSEHSRCPECGVETDALADTGPVQTTVDYFETIYQEAQGDASRIRWANGVPNPALVSWLNAVAPSIIRCGARVVCVGCGLGDDARELMNRGYEVTAFDCSKTAIEWAKKLDGVNTHCYHTADLFQIPVRWKHRYDLVVEINTIQSLSPDRHRAAISAVGDLVSPNGHLLVICRGTNKPVSMEDGPPWALTQGELLEAAALAGLKPAEPISVFMDNEDPPVCRMRGLFRRA